MTQGRTGAVVNDHEIIPGRLYRFRDFQVPSDRLRLSQQARLGDRVAFFDANDLRCGCWGIRSIRTCWCWVRAGSVD